ncbi:hypothetical protein ACJMK2_039312 [Sinanodonta woodiana]|uniref:C-type lectin domain-containing protein n=1 Tax=Sinanodonta woodiana TaxID=1069815 RepID=A0ABD3WCP4_SINWO
MQYFLPMAAFVCLISLFEIGHLIENNVQMQVYRIMEELLELKGDFAELQKSISNERRGLNQDILEIHKLIANENKTICNCSRGAASGQQYELSTPIVNEKDGSSLSNYEVLNKLDMILKGLAKEKATRIDFMKANEAMEDTFRQNFSYLATKIDNVRKNIDNKIIETNANALKFGTKLEDKVSTIERKIKETMSNLNKTLDDLDEHVEKMHLDQEESAPKCGNGWRKFNSSCYTFIHLNMSWFAAEQYCQLFGSHLIRIDDHSEFQFIQGVLTELHKKRLKDGAKTLSHYWTAGNDIIKEGDWVWTPLNVPIRYPAWYEMEPNNSNGQEHCAEIDIHRHFKMNDHNCQMDFFPICEIDRKNG